MVRISNPWKNISKYVLASAVMGVVLLLLPHSTGILTANATMTEKILNILHSLVLTAVGGIIYLAILMVIDKEVRTLPKAVLQEIKRKKSPIA